MARRLIVIGAGPIGLEAALGARELGFEVTVLERDAAGASLEKWGSTRFFSPAGMNLGRRSRALLGSAAPRAEALLTGQEYRQVLLALAERSPLRELVKNQHRVISVGRARMTKSDYPNHPLRAERPFRLLVEGPGGQEDSLEAEVVLDASGVSELSAGAGMGGMPVLGERALAKNFVRGLGALEREIPSLAGKSLLLLGHGHSAANALAQLSRAGDIRVTWATRSPNARPCVEVANDPLPERREIVAAANDLAERSPPWLKVERRAHAESFAPQGEQIEAKLTGGRGGAFDAVAAFTGYRPDISLLSELPVHLSPISEGALGVQRALANVTDCLNVPQLSAKDLASGEPGFYLIGHKSYGRMSTFLLETGFSQLDTVLALVKN